MRHAVRLAHLAESEGEVPVGAVLVKDETVIGEGWNRPIVDNDPTAHAEIIALKEASNRLENYRLNEAIIYTTLEPCLMCAGAAFWTQIGNIIYAASDEKRGFSTYKTSVLHPSTKIKNGLLADKSTQLLQDFFAKKRGL